MTTSQLINALKSLPAHCADKRIYLEYKPLQTEPFNQMFIKVYVTALDNSSQHTFFIEKGNGKLCFNE